MAWPEHIQWLVANRGAALLDCLGSQGADKSIEDVLEVLVDADPSPGHHSVQWLCDTLLGGGMRWEDVAEGGQSRAGETLVCFAQHRRALPRGLRNLEDYASLATVWQAVEPMVSTDTVQADLDLGGRARRRAQRLEAYAQSLVLCNTPELVVAVPTTSTAAIWWGRGTKWCTSADSNNMFSNYNMYTPLIVAVLPKVAGCKLQLHIHADGGVQFMDATDQTVSKEFVHQHWTELACLVQWALTRTGAMLGYVPPELCSHDMCMAAVGTWGRAIRDVPLHMRDKAMYELAIQTYPSAITLMPAEYLDAELCQRAVGMEPMLISSLPRQVVSRDLCLQAIRLRADVLSRIDLDLVDEQMCLEAVGKQGSLLSWVSQANSTPQVCKAAVRNYGYVIKYVPREHIDAAMCLDAVHANGAWLAEIPEDMRTLEVCLAALQNSTRAYGDIPIHLRVLPEVCMAAVQSYGGLLGRMDPQLRTRELCMVAVDNSQISLAFVPYDSRDPELCLAAVSKYPDAIGYVPTHVKTDAWYLAAFQATPDMFAHMPPHLLTRDICMTAVANNGWLLTNDVVRTYADHDMYMAGVRNSGQVLGLLAPQDLDAQLCTLAFGQDMRALDLMPDEYITPQMSRAYVVEFHDLGPIPDRHLDAELCAIAVLYQPSQMVHVPPAIESHVRGLLLESGWQAPQQGVQWNGVEYFKDFKTIPVPAGTTLVSPVGLSDLDSLELSAPRPL